MAAYDIKDGEYTATIYNMVRTQVQNSATSSEMIMEILFQGLIKE